MDNQNGKTRSLYIFIQGLQEIELVTHISNRISTVLSKYSINRAEIIRAFPDFADIDTVQTVNGIQMKLPNLTKIFKMKVPTGIVRDSVIKGLNELEEVLYAERNSGVVVTQDPLDSYFPNQWHLKQVLPNMTRGPDIMAPEAWDIFTGSSNIKIAVIENGVYANHPDLSGRVTPALQFTQNHSTGVAGVAAGKANNSYAASPYFGVVGVDWNATILNVGYVQYADAAELYTMITGAVNSGAHVLNCSWYTLDPDLATIKMAFAYAYRNDRVSVTSTGNEGNPGTNPRFPGAYGNGIIAVGGTDKTDERYPTSNYGSHIDVVAPGTQIYSASGIDGIGIFEGTSFAAPIVSGIASLIKGFRPNLHNDDIENIIKLSADKVRPDLYTYQDGWNIQMGYGRVNARKALDYLRAPYALTHYSAYGGVAVLGSETDFIGTAIFGVQGLEDGPYLVKRVEVRKTVTFAPNTNPEVWGIGFTTTGWANESVLFGMGWCEVVPGTKTSTSAELRTFVYKVYHAYGPFIGWYPAQPTNVQFGYSVLGPFSSSISGPTIVHHAEHGSPANQYTWTANVLGGSPNFSYVWKKDGLIVGTNSPTYTEYLSYNGSGGGSYQFTLRVDVTDSQSGTTFATRTVTAYNSGGIDPEKAADKAAEILPIDFVIRQNYPNPFNPETEISFGLPEPSSVKVTIIDVLGREIIDLVNEEYSSGYQRVVWNGADRSGNKVGSGVYFYRIVATGQSGKQFSKVLKMALTK